LELKIDKDVCKKATVLIFNSYPVFLFGVGIHNLSWTIRYRSTIVDYYKIYAKWGLFFYCPNDWGRKSRKFAL